MWILGGQFPQYLLNQLQHISRLLLTRQKEPRALGFCLHLPQTIVLDAQAWEIGKVAWECVQMSVCVSLTLSTWDLAALLLTSIGLCFSLVCNRTQVCFVMGHAAASFSDLLPASSVACFSWEKFLTFLNYINSHSLSFWPEFYKEGSPKNP